MRGRTIAGYRIECEIGRGGQAVVYRATQTGLGRVAALKLLAPGAESDPSARARFEREAHSIAALEHPHILPVYEAGEADGQYFIAMKYVSGGVLADVLRADGALPVPRALTLLGQLASALDHAHENDVAHRDIKPANILIEGDQHAYLADFGLSRHSLAPALTPIGAWLGTPEYVAPEVLRGDPPGPAADRYAFALLAFEALTGRPPFSRSTPAAIIYSHLNDPPPRADGLRPDLGKRVSSALTRGMAKRWDRRPESAGELVASIADAVERTPGALEASAPAKDEGSPEIARPTRLAPTFGPPPQARPRHRRRGWLDRRKVAVGGLAVLLAGGLLVGVRGLGEPAPPDATTASAGIAAPQVDAADDGGGNGAAGAPDERPGAADDPPPRGGGDGGPPPGGQPAAAAPPPPPGPRARPGNPGGGPPRLGGDAPARRS